MGSEDTVALVQAAKAGDGEAWTRLVERFWDRWLSRYQRDLGTTIRRLYDAEDLVQSALVEAAQHIGDLRDEGAFFVWVTAIVRHKLARKRASLRREKGGRAAPAGEPEARGDVAPEEALATDEEYLQVLDAILSLFPDAPRPMAALVLFHLEGLAVDAVAARLGRPRRTTYHWIRKGEALLRARLRA